MGAFVTKKHVLHQARRVGRRHRRARILTVVLGVALALLVSPTPANAATTLPDLQLPWPTGIFHAINGGDTYGCNFHINADYFAIDFQVGGACHCY